MTINNINKKNDTSKLDLNISHNLKQKYFCDIDKAKYYYN